MALLGIDLGTSSVKVMVLDAQGRTLGVSKMGYAVTAPQPGWSESDPNEWWAAVVSAVRAVLARVPQAEISALGLSGQMHGLILTDGAGQPLRAALLWSDMRAQAALGRYRRLPASLLEAGLGSLQKSIREHEFSRIRFMKLFKRCLNVS